ncbi:MAG: molybdopterin molybdotransferase MoeA [Deltaproteobacteria bacterium]|nr:molybdopterin molybdotransferase MoeA [Deltaproteobacteria bacterium]
MTTVDEAVKLVLENVSPLPSEKVSVADSLGRVLCEDVRSGRDVPSFANSAMDGFAVRWSDLAGASSDAPASLAVRGEVAAGGVSRKRVLPGTAIRIMTGAPVPAGADTIVRVEHTEPRGDRVAVFRTDGEGSHIRPAGEDIGKGQLILERGKLLRAADIGLMASIGKARVTVRRRPVVAIIATGDELIGVDDKPTRGKVVNSNGYTLSSAVREIGAVPKSFGIVRDNRNRLAGAFRRALRCDALITSGGVSVGDYDYVKDALGDAGMRMLFWKVAQRPGHPMAFGRVGPRPVFGLPGNPVSSLVSFILYVRPALLKMMGHERLFMPVVRARLADDIRTARGLKEFVRCRIEEENGRLVASSTGTQSSGVLRSLSLAQGLIVAREDQTVLRKGSHAPTILLDHGQRWLQEEMGF